MTEVTFNPHNAYGVHYTSSPADHAGNRIHRIEYISTDRQPSPDVLQAIKREQSSRQEGLCHKLSSAIKKMGLIMAAILVFQYLIRNNNQASKYFSQLNQKFWNLSLVSSTVNYLRSLTARVPLFNPA